MAKKKFSKKRYRRNVIISRCIFYFFYLATVLALLFLIKVGVTFVNDYMCAYESSQVRYVAEEAAKPFTELDYEKLADCVDPSVYPYEHREQYVEYLKNMLEGREITYSERAADNENERRYIVKADNMSIGSFTVRHTSEDKYNLWQWEPAEMDTDMLISSEYFVNVPTGSVVTVDGTVLTDDNIIERNIPFLEKYEDLPEDAAIPTRCIYRFERYFDVNDVTVTDKYGRDCAVTQEDNTYTAAYNYDDAILEEDILERATKVVRRLSCVTSGDYTEWIFTDEDVVKDSPAEKFINGFDYMWIMSHKSYEFLNMDMSNYIRYSDTFFSIEARYDYKIIYYTVDPEIYPTAYRLYFKLVGGEKWKLYDFTVI